MSAKDVVDLGKSIFELLKGLLIAALIVMFVAAPGLINRGLAAIGIKEFDLWGLKGSTALVQVYQDLEGQKQVNVSLTERLQKTTDALTRITQERDDNAAQLKKISERNPTLVDPSSIAVTANFVVKELVAANNGAIGAAEANQAATAQTLSTVAQTVAAAQSTAAPSTGRWGVVFGADSNPDEGRPELKKAREAGFTDNARLYLRQKWYRSVVEFPSQEAASDALPKIRGLSPNARKAYVVALATWCPNAVQRAPDVIDCQM